MMNRIEEYRTRPLRPRAGAFAECSRGAGGGIAESDAFHQPHPCRRSGSPPDGVQHRRQQLCHAAGRRQDGRIRGLLGRRCQMCAGRDRTSPTPAKRQQSLRRQSPWSSPRQSRCCRLQSRTSLTAPMRCAKQNGVAALRVNDKLMQAAQVRADEMAASGVYSHTRPDGRKSNTVTDSKYTGENIHSISELYLEQQHKTLSEAVVKLWSNSKAHADNMTKLPLLARSASDWRGALTKTVLTAGTACRSSCWTAVKSLGWIRPQVSKSSTLTQEQIGKVCSFYYAFLERRTL